MAIRGWVRTVIDTADKMEAHLRVENVLIHYVGHGMFKTNSAEHYLSINTTDAEDPSMTSASLGQLNDILLKNAPRQRRIYLIDACFAAASIKDLMGAPEDAIEVNVGGILGAWPESDWGERGVAALCSADRTATASAGGERELTQFTDGLLTVFETGDKVSDASLSLRRTHQLLRGVLKTRYGDDAVHPVLVAPEDRDGGIAAAPIFPNLAKRRRGSEWLDRILDRAPANEASSRPIEEDADSHDASRHKPVERAASDSATSSSHGQAEGTMVPEAGGAETSAWGVAVGETATLDREAILSPELRFRQAAYRFFRLPHSKKDEIAKEFDPPGKSNAHLPDFERYKTALAKARESGAVDRLESMIVQAERG